MPATTPTWTPLASRMTGWRRSAAVRKVPTWATPACSSRFAVCTSPSKPWSSAWLEAVVQASQPIDAIHGAISRRCGEDGVGLQCLAGRRERHLLVAQRQVGVLDQGLHVGEHRVEVVRRAARRLRRGALPDGVVPEQVAAHDQLEPARLGLRLLDHRRCRRRGRVRPAEHDARAGLRSRCGVGEGSAGHGGSKGRTGDHAHVCPHSRKTHEGDPRLPGRLIECQTLVL